MNKLGKMFLKLSVCSSVALSALIPAAVFAENAANSEAAADAGTAATAAADATASTANSSNTAGGLPMWAFLLIWIAIFVVIGYFLIYRPNKKRKKEEEEMRASLALGSEVTTIGGICGKVVNIKDDNVTIETSLDRTLFEVKNWAIREIKKPVTDDQ